VAVRGAHAKRLSTGLAAGAATAWIADLYDDRGSGTAARIAAAANFFGGSAGPLLAGLLAQFAPAPLRLPFFIYLILLCGVAIAIAFAPETVVNRKLFNEVSLKPRLGVPRGIRLQFLSPAVAGFITFSLIGFYAALIPGVLADSLHVSAPAVSGGIVCELFGVAAVTILVTGRLGFWSAPKSPNRCRCCLPVPRSAASPAGSAIAAALKWSTVSRLPTAAAKSSPAISSRYLPAIPCQSSASAFCQPRRAHLTRT